MRLIDADKLEEKIDDISRGYTSVYGVEEDDIYNAETVEAISLDWIESYALLAEADGRPFFAEGIRDMVEEWKQAQKGS